MTEAESGSFFGPLGFGKCTHIVAAENSAPDNNASSPSTSPWALMAGWSGEDATAARRQQQQQAALSSSPPKMQIPMLALPNAGNSARSNSTRSSEDGGGSTTHGSRHSCSSTHRSRAPTSNATPHQRSPASCMRLMSASQGPAPHPLAELTRLTAARHLLPMARLIHSMASMSRPGKERSQRKTNQDSVFAYRQYIQPYQAIAAVLDGHGPNGDAVSGFIKAQMPGAVADQLRRNGEAAAAASLRGAFLQLHAGLRTTPGINARLSGSTAVVSLLQGRRLTTAWVGDSRAVLLRRELGGGWRGVALTHDHKPTSAGELARILAAGGRVERLSDGAGREVGPQRVWLPGSWVPGLAMSRAMGDFVAHSVGVTAEPDINVCELEAGDEYLVVASDGVWEFMTAQEVADVAGGSESAEVACRAVMDAATERWECTNEGVVDDISVVVTKFSLTEFSSY